MKALSQQTLLLYALPAFPLALLGLPLYIYLPTFYVEHVGLDVTAVGLILFVSRLLDMINDPVIGFVNDRYSKNQTLMVWGAVFVLLGFYALTHPLSTPSPLWLFGFSLLAYFGWSLVTIPYLSLAVKLGTSRYENTRLSSWREVANILGVVTALTLPYIFDVSDKSDEAMLLLWQLVAVCLPIFVTISVFGIREPKTTYAVQNFMSSVKAFWKKYPSSKLIFGAFLINGLANALPATLFLFFTELVIGAPEAVGGLLLLYFIAGIVMLPFWLYLTRHFSKIRVWIMSMGGASAAFVFVPFLGSGDLWWFLLITLFSGFSLGADMALPASIQTDIAQEANKEGNKLSGVLFGIWALLTKLSLAIAVGIAFGLLGVVDFEPSAPSDAALLMLSLLYGLLPVILKVCAIWILLQIDKKPLPKNTITI